MFENSSAHQNFMLVLLSHTETAEIRLFLEHYFYRTCLFLLLVYSSSYFIVSAILTSSLTEYDWMSLFTLSTYYPLHVILWICSLRFQDLLLYYWIRHALRLLINRIVLFEHPKVDFNSIFNPKSSIWLVVSLTLWIL